MKTFGGKVLFLNRSDINTDEIIPAKYLTEVDKEALGPHMLEDLKLDGFDPESKVTKEASVIITRENFGCGSSREHAPWALEVNGITAVIAKSYARIFRQNMFNCGMLSIELDDTQIDELFKFENENDLTCTIDIDSRTIELLKNSDSIAKISFKLGQFEDALVKAGGWVEYADNNL
ncbi:MAG: 3-isopropylmalate dehydratase small subunit [Deltaproteobacteria bacterium]|nr:3-isopropylmalate dehydratase small subunit [Deltaproteobacteria bacterium]